MATKWVEQELLQLLKRHGKEKPLFAKKGDYCGSNAAETLPNMFTVDVSNGDGLYGTVILLNEIVKPGSTCWKATALLHCEGELAFVSVDRLEGLEFYLSYDPYWNGKVRKDIAIVT